MSDNSNNPSTSKTKMTVAGRANIDSKIKDDIRKKINKIVKTKTEKEKNKVREKYNLSDSHSDTSSDCSFQKHPVDKYMSSDKTYNIKIEKLLPKNLRRRRFEKLPEKLNDERNSFLTLVRKNPKEFQERKGILTYLATVDKKKDYTEKKKNTQKMSDIIADHPWIPFLTDAEKQMNKEFRDMIIREKYYELVNPEEIDLQNENVMRFVRWYEKKQKGKIEEPEITFSVQKNTRNGNKIKSDNKTKSGNKILKPVRLSSGSSSPSDSSSSDISDDSSNSLIKYKKVSESSEDSW